jgi:hypothetical protein
VQPPLSLILIEATRVSGWARRAAEAGGVEEGSRGSGVGVVSVSAWGNDVGAAGAGGVKEDEPS